jgi:YVTN family beta-propeller protein
MHQIHERLSTRHSNDSWKSSFETLPKSDDFCSPHSGILQFLVRCCCLRYSGSSAAIRFVTGLLTLALATVPVHGQSVIATVQTGTGPNALATNPVTNKIYVTNGSSNSVTIIDGATNTTAAVSVGASPDAVAVNSMTNKIYVSNHDDSSVTVIDGSTNATTSVDIKDIPGRSPTNLPVAIAVNPAANKIYAAASSNDGFRQGVVAVINGTTNSLSTFVTAQQVVKGMALNPMTNKIYVIGVDAGGGPPIGSLLVIDGATNRSTLIEIHSGGEPSAIVVNPVTNRIYVADKDNNDVTVINGADNTKTTVSVGNAPVALAVNTRTNKIYVTNSASNTITMIDGTNNTPTTTPQFIATPSAIAVDEGTNKIYVLGSPGHAVAVIEGISLSLDEELSVGDNPGALAVNPATDRVYVANVASNTVTVIDGSQGAPSPGLTLTATPANVTVKLGHSVTSTLTVTEFGGINANVLLTVTGSMPGLTATIDPTVVAPGQNATVTFSASPTAPAGVHSFDILAQVGEEFSTTASMNVTVDASPNFLLSALPSSLSVAQGSSASTTITALAVGGFSNNISFTVCCLPAGVSARVGPIPAPGSGDSALTFIVSSNTAPGTTNLTISASGGGVVNRIPFPLTITPAAPTPVSYTFAVGTTVGSVRVVTQGTENLDFTAGTGTTCVPKAYAAGDSCTVLVAFTPHAPGLRTGAVQILDPAGNLLFQTLLSNTSTAAQVVVFPGEIGTAAGNGQAGFGGDNGPANLAALNTPYGIIVDAAGNLFIADLYNHRIRKVDAATHVITTIAGLGSAGYSGDGGPAAAAELNQPLGVALDGAGNVYIADADNDVVREIDARTGIITTVAGNGSPGFSGDGGPATDAQLFFPFRVTLDGTGNIYITDSSNAIRKVDAVTHLITTVAGNGSPGFSGDGGPATEAQLNEPRGVALDAAGNLYIADYFNTRIRKVDAGTKVITTVAGDGQFGNGIGDGGPAVDAHLFFPPAVAVDAAGDLYIADSDSHHVRRVAAASGFIDAIAGAPDLGQGLDFNGDGLPAPLANLREPDDAAIDGAGNLYVADALNQRIRVVSAVAAPLNFPQTTVGSVSATQSVTVFNTGNQPLGIELAATSAEFGIDVQASTCLTGASPLLPGSSCVLGVTFAPKTPGQHSGTLSFETDEADGAAHTVKLSGLGGS